MPADQSDQYDTSTPEIWCLEGTREVTKVFLPHGRSKIRGEGTTSAFKLPNSLARIGVARHRSVARQGW